MEPHELFTDTVKTLFLPWASRQVTIRVPAGTPDGTVLRIPGLGNPAVPGGPPQDGYVQIRVTPAVGQPGPAPAPAPHSPPSFEPPPTYGPPPSNEPPPAYGPPPAFTGSPAYGSPPPFGAAPPAFSPVQPASKGGAKTRRNVLIGGATALVLLAGCCGAALLISDDDPSDSPTAAGPAGVTPLDPLAYQTALTTADTTLARRSRALAAAKSPKSVRALADALQSAVDQQRTTLAAVAPPTPVVGAHRELTAALAALSASLGGTDMGEPCLGPAAASSLSRLPATDDLRAVSTSLRTADPAQPYTFGSFVPKETKQTNRRLTNGTFVTRTGRGPGRLEITNGRGDSVVSLVRKGSKKPAVRVYLRSKKKFTVRGVADGTYQVFMTNGVDWDSRLKAFSRECTFQKFDDTIKFTTTFSTYSIWKISITPVVGGNATSSDVDPDDFPN
ncbi:MAG TPA: DnaJ C-terminal domain-containing protein [Actinoplanes sp.]|nr:DnaJ C-terminal domain-containing protein [Actinoplanes sp.]